MSIAWTDPVGAVLLTVAGLAIIAAVLGLLAWDARRRRSPSIILDVTAAVARMWIALVGVGIVIAVWRWLSAGDTWIEALPVSMPWPTTLPCEAGTWTESFTTATLVCAHVDSVDATIVSLSLGAKLLLATGEVLSLIVVALPAVVVSVICGQAHKGAPFTRLVSRWLFIAAIVILVAGLGSEIATSAGRALAAAEVLPAPTGPGDSGVTSQYFRLTVPVWPIGAALALSALGVVFRHGAVLQRETEGLV